MLNWKHGPDTIFKWRLFYSPVIISSGHRFGFEEESISSERVIQPMQWGLVPSWHKGSPKKVSYETNNCRSESMMERPTYKTPLQKGRRCVVLADGYVSESFCRCLLVWALDKFRWAFLIIWHLSVHPSVNFVQFLTSPEPQNQFQLNLPLHSWVKGIPIFFSNKESHPFHKGERCGEKM